MFEVGNRVHWVKGKGMTSSDLIGEDEIYTVEKVDPDGKCDLKTSTGAMIYAVDPDDLELVDPNPAGA